MDRSVIRPSSLTSTYSENWGAPFRVGVQTTVMSAPEFRCCSNTSATGRLMAVSPQASRT